MGRIVFKNIENMRYFIVGFLGCVCSFAAGIIYTHPGIGHLLVAAALDIFACICIMWLAGEANRLLNRFD